MDELKSNALLQHPIYRESEIINQQVVEMLVVREFMDFHLKVKKNE